MPPLVRRSVLVSAFALGASLAFASVAYADKGGFTPVEPYSPNAERIDQAYNWISIFALAILVVVEGALIWFVIRYRRGRRARTVEGPQIHGATRLELIWTAVPVLIVAAIVAFVLYKLPGIQDVPAARAQGGPLEIRVDAHQFYWRFTYPNGATSINDLHVPVDRVVRVRIHSQDVDHSWWVPALQGKFDALPGEETETWFRAERAGTYRGQCGEFCGVYHASMRARVIAEPKSAYDDWARSGAREALGRSEWVGVCAQCHGMTGRGAYGPSIFNNSILLQRESLRELLRNGQNASGDIADYMPPVGRGWSDEQFRALEDYLEEEIYEGAGNGG